MTKTQKNVLRFLAFIPLWPLIAFAASVCTLMFVLLLLGSLFIFVIEGRWMWPYEWF